MYAHKGYNISVETIHKHIRSICGVNCYLRPSWLVMFVCISRLVTPAYTLLVSSVQLHCSRSGKAESVVVVHYGTIISYFMMPFECFDCFGRKPFISTNPSCLCCLFHHGHSSKLNYNFQDCPTQKLSMMCTHGSRVPWIGQLTTDLLIRIPVHIHTTWDSHEWTPVLDGEIWQKGVFLFCIIKPWLMTLCVRQTLWFLILQHNICGAYQGTHFTYVTVYLRHVWFLGYFLW
jgi:hypothetical protein